VTRFDLDRSLRIPTVVGVDESRVEVRLGGLVPVEVELAIPVLDRLAG